MTLAIFFLAIYVSVLAFLLDFRIQNLELKLKKQVLINEDYKFRFQGLNLTNARTNMTNQVSSQIVNLHISGILTKQSHAALVQIGLDALDKCNELLKSIPKDASNAQFIENYEKQITIFNKATDDVVIATKIFITEMKNLSLVANSSTNVSSSLLRGEDIDKTKLN